MDVRTDGPVTKRKRAVRPEPEPDNRLTLAEVTALELAALAALDGYTADLGESTRVQLDHARVKLERAILRLAKPRMR